MIEDSLMQEGTLFNANTSLNEDVDNPSAEQQLNSQDEGQDDLTEERHQTTLPDNSPQKALQSSNHAPSSYMMQ